MLDAVSIRTQGWLLRRLHGLAERAGRLRARPEHLVVGERGEREAIFHLRSEGYTLVARRWRTGRLRGDLDLVAWDGATLCFIEVKTRSRRNLLDPAEAAVDLEKRRMLRKMARAYLAGFPEDARGAVVSRFDLLAVYLGGERADQLQAPEFDLTRAAFGWRE